MIIYVQLSCKTANLDLTNIHIRLISIMFGQYFKQISYNKE